MRFTCLLVAVSRPARAQEQEQNAEIYPLAILEFAERGTGMKGKGKNVADIMFAKLVTNPNLYLVERAELKKVLDELTLNASGMVASKDATQVGQLTGAKVLVTGSVFKAGKKTYIVAKVIGTETGKVVGSSVNGVEDVSDLSEKLAGKVGKLIQTSAAKLMPEKVDHESRLAALQKALKGKTLPPATIKIPEVHIGRPAVDPAAETELSMFYRELGGKLIDAGHDNKKFANLHITGEGFSEYAGATGKLRSVKARVEVKVRDADGNIVAVDRQTTVAVDLTEIKAGKTALQEAGAMIATRLLPKLAKKKNAE